MLTTHNIFKYPNHSLQYPDNWTRNHVSYIHMGVYPRIINKYVTKGTLTDDLMTSVSDIPRPVFGSDIPWNFKCVQKTRGNSCMICIRVCHYKFAHMNGHWKVYNFKALYKKQLFTLKVCIRWPTVSYESKLSCLGIHFLNSLKLQLKN